jgi:hypothetical protein
MTGTNCDLFTHKSSRSNLNHLFLFIICTSINKDSIKSILCGDAFDVSQEPTRFAQLLCRWHPMFPRMAVNKQQFTCCSSCLIDSNITGYCNWDCYFDSAPPWHHGLYHVSGHSMKVRVFADTKFVTLHNQMFAGRVVALEINTHVSRATAASLWRRADGG